MPKRKLTLEDQILKVSKVIKTEAGVVKWKCEADVDDKCDYEQKKMLRPGNFKRHIITGHPVVAKELGFDATDEKSEEVQKKARVPKLLVESSTATVIHGTLMLLSSHNLPFNFASWKGTKVLLQPLYKAANLKLSREFVTELVSRAAKVMREQIKKKISKQIVCLKIDSASRGGRSMFAVNLQYLNENCEVEIIHLATREMIDRQTKEKLSEVMNEELTIFNIDQNQLLGIASDNGANMLAAVKCLKQLMTVETDSSGVSLGCMIPSEYAIVQKMATDSDSDDDDDTVDTEDEDDEDDCNTSIVEEEENDDFVEGYVEPESTTGAGHENLEDIPEPLLESIRCGAHTAQLAVWDVIKQYNTRLNNINLKCKAMRHIRFRRQFVANKVALPPKVNRTRWNMWYVLLRYLQSLRTTPLLADLEAQDKNLNLSRHWSFIDKFCDAFAPMFTLTLALQKTHVPLSQFYSDWLICQALLSGIATEGNGLAKKLLKAMKIRIDKLSQSMPFKASLYLDPRFNFLGSGRMSAEDKNAVKKYLLSLNTTLDAIEGVTVSQEGDDGGNNSDSESFIEKYLTDLFNEDSSIASTEGAPMDPLLEDIVKLESRQKVKVKSDSDVFDIIDYWQQRRYSNPRIYRLARAVLAAPSTQVTVERLFSHLKRILSDERMRLVSEILAEEENAKNKEKSTEKS